MAILFEMTEDFKDSLEDQGVVFEDGSIKQQQAVLYGNKMKEAEKIYHEAVKHKQQGDYRGAIQLYNKCIKLYKEAKKEADKIPDVSIKDFGHYGNVIGNYAILKLHPHDNKNVKIKNSPRAFAKHMIDLNIQEIRNGIDECNEKIKNNIKESYDYFIDDEFDF